MEVIPPPRTSSHHEEARQSLPSPPSELGSSSPLSSILEGQDDTITPLYKGEGGASTSPVKKLPARIRSPSKALLEKMAAAEGSSAHAIKSAHPVSFNGDVKMKELGESFGSSGVMGVYLGCCTLGIVLRRRVLEESTSEWCSCRLISRKFRGSLEPECVL